MDFRLPIDEIHEVTPEMAARLKEQLEKARNIRIKAEATIENLENREKEDWDALAKLGIDINNPEEEIQRLKQRAIELYREIDANIPYDILNEVK